MSAVDHLQEGAVRQLLAHGSNVNAADVRGWQPLHVAAGATQTAAIDIVAQLLAAGAAVNAPATASSVTPLLKAVWRGRTDVVQLLLKEGADPDAANAHGTTPLMFAAQYKEWGKAAASLEAGAAVNRADPRGNTALTFAVREGNLGGVLALLEAGAAVNIVNINGLTCLIESSRLPPEAHDRCQIVDALLAAGATVAAADKEGVTALMMAAAFSGPAVVAALLAAGAAVNTAAEDGTTCLIATCTGALGYCSSNRCCAEAAAVVGQLVAAGADVNAANKQGCSALMAAAQAGAVEVVEALLKAGAAVNAAKDQGMTALLLAVEAMYSLAPQHRYDEIVAQLLRRVQTRLQQLSMGPPHCTERLSVATAPSCSSCWPLERSAMHWIITVRCRMQVMPANDAMLQFDSCMAQRCMLCDACRVSFTQCCNTLPV
jgi:ankyrin repeat protein